MGGPTPRPRSPTPPGRGRADRVGLGVGEAVDADQGQHPLGERPNDVGADLGPQGVADEGEPVPAEVAGRPQHVLDVEVAEVRHVDRAVIGSSVPGQVEGHQVELGKAGSQEIEGSGIVLPAVDGDGGDRPLAPATSPQTARADRDLHLQRSLVDRAHGRILPDREPIATAGRARWGTTLSRAASGLAGVGAVRRARRPSGGRRAQRRGRRSGCGSPNRSRRSGGAGNRPGRRSARLWRRGTGRG